MAASPLSAFPAAPPGAPGTPVAGVAAGAAVAAGAVAALWLFALVVAGGPVILALGLAPAAVAALVDGREARVPDVLVACTAAFPLVFVLGGAVGAATVLTGAAITAAPLLALHLLGPDHMGFGDVKLAAALGALLAPLDVRAGFVTLAVGSGVTLVAALVGRRRAVPFAPGLVAGASVALVALPALGWEAPRWR